MPLIIQIRLNRELRIKVIFIVVSGSQLSAELGPHTFFGEVGDMSNHPGDTESPCGPFCIVIVSVGEIRVGQNGVSAYRVERYRLGAEVAGRCYRQDRPDKIRVKKRPLQDLHPANGAAYDRQQFFYAELIQHQFLHFDHISDGDNGEIEAIRFAGFWINRGRPRCSGAAA